jgi:predicted metal-dependent phosphoesterase TrpH
MKIDLHIHTSTGSDGALSLEEVMREAERRKIGFIAITDHDNIMHQQEAVKLAAFHRITAITGVELNVTFPYQGKSLSLDFLGYRYDPMNQALREKLQVISKHREKRARQIVSNLNAEFTKEGRPLFNDDDLVKMQESVDGVLSRPHIADYLMKKGIVASRQEAFDKYLVKCDVPKYPLSLEEASLLIKGAGGKLMLAHPNDPNGTSLVGITKDLDEQTNIIAKEMLGLIDGVECWHSRADETTTNHYLTFCEKHKIIKTGGSDCHQKPVLMGSLAIPGWVAQQF